MCACKMLEVSGKAVHFGDIFSLNASKTFKRTVLRLQQGLFKQWRVMLRTSMILPLIFQVLMSTASCIRHSLCLGTLGSVSEHSVLPGRAVKLLSVRG